MPQPERALTLLIAATGLRISECLGLQWADVDCDRGTKMELYAQSDMDAMRDAQGKFLEQLMGDKIHLLTERVQ